MTTDDIITQVLSAGALLGGIAAMISAWRSRRQGIRSDEREARQVEAAQRRDTIADRDSLIETFQEEVHDLKTRFDVLEKELRLEREWNRMLVDHIYRGNPPPPPQRPLG